MTVPRGKMTALVKSAQGSQGLRLDEVPIPELGDEDVLVEVKAAAICGTDLHIFHDSYPVEMPLTIGHEFSGVIARTGPGVNDWEVGTPVIAEGNVENCGVCSLCTGGKPNLCRENRYLGIRCDGVFARYVKIPAKLLHQIPSTIGFEEAALAEPAAVAIDALLEKNSLRPRDNLVILGCGPIGLLAGQVARASGADKIILTGRESAVKTRFKVAAETGVFDYLLNVEREDAVTRVMELTNRLGADLVLDTTGSAAALHQAFQMIRRHGTIVVVGMGDPVIEVPWPQMMREIIKIHFCRGTTFESFSRFCSLCEAGTLNLKPLISGVFPLEKWKVAFAAVENREGVKSLLIP